MVVPYYIMPKRTRSLVSMSCSILNCICTDQTVEKQTEELKAISRKYEHDKRYWIVSISQLEEKVKVIPKCTFCVHSLLWISFMSTTRSIFFLHWNNYLINYRNWKKSTLNYLEKHMNALIQFQSWPKWCQQFKS